MISLTRHTDDRTLLRYLEAGLSEPDREKVESHLSRCHDCAGRLSFLSRLPKILDEPLPDQPDREVLEKARMLVSPKVAPKTILRFPGPRYRFVFAGAAVAFVALFIYVFVPDKERDRFRSEEDRTEKILTLLPADGATLHDRSTPFRWSPLGDSLVYRFSLMEPTGSIIWSTDVRDTAISLPPSIVLQSGNTYLWRVETFIGDRSTERSPLHAFTFVPH